MVNYKQKLERGATVSPSGCWLWLRSQLPTGYGRLRYHGRIEYAHRVAFQEWHGSIPEGLHVLHSCDVPACCNPDHLRAGTPKDNAIDRETRGRGAGAKNFRKSTKSE